MRLEVAGKPSLERLSDSKLRAAIATLRTYGPSSFASLTDKYGNAIHVAGGGDTCLLEFRDAVHQRHYRAYHGTPQAGRPDGTLLVFAGAEIPMQADEWFTADTVAQAFIQFLRSKRMPDCVTWRDRTSWCLPTPQQMPEAAGTGRPACALPSAGGRKATERYASSQGTSLLRT